MPTGKPQSTIYGPIPTEDLQMANKAYVDSQGIGGESVVKKLDETVNNSTTLQDDDELFISLLVNKVYAGFLHLYLQSDTTPALKFTFAIPAGASGERQTGIQRSDAITNTLTITNTTNLATNAGLIQWLSIPFRVIMGGTVGNIQFRWAQNVADVSDTKILKGSLLVIWEENA